MAGSPLGQKMAAIAQVLGIGRVVSKLPDPVVRKFADFSKGYNSSVDPKILDKAASPFIQDFAVDAKNRLVRFPGIESLENVSPRTPEAMFTHGGLDQTTELVFFDAPYMGVKQEDDPTDWYNLGLPTGPAWVACNHGGTLVFTNGFTSIYTRDSLATIITDAAFGPARTLASFAGRVFAGGVTLSGLFEPLGVAWTGADGLPTSWTGPGSGSELLLHDVAEGDWLVALRPIGFDFLAILLRKSVWVGRRTGDPLRPVDFSPRIPGIGCAAERTAKAVNGGVCFLSDSGVKFFDGSGIGHISAPIDGDLLPIDFTQLGLYSAVYSPVTDSYILFTPICTWAYEFQQNRWTRSSLTRVIQAVSLWNPALISSSGLPAGWGIYWSGSWGVEITSSNTILSDIVFLKDSEIGKDNDELTSYFGIEQVTEWDSPVDDTDDSDSMFTYNLVKIEYVSDVAATFDLLVRNLDGSYKALITGGSLPDTGTKKATARFQRNVSGETLDFKFQLKTGFAAISTIHVRGEPRSDKLPSHV